MMKPAAFNCALCSFFESNNGCGRRFTSMKKAKIHARVRFDQIQMVEDGEIDEGQMFERCFPKPTRNVRQSRRSLADICRSLICKRSKRSSINCTLCGSDINIRQRHQYPKREYVSVSTRGILDHACIHAGVKPFNCRRCEKPFRGRANVWAHFKSVHGTTPAKHDLDIQTDRFYDEISNSIQRCFTKNGTASKEAKEKIHDEIYVRQHLVNGSDLVVQRHIFFTRTLKESVESDGRVRCRMCSIKIQAKRSAESGTGEVFKTQRAIHHAQCHLRKPLYRCKVCNESFNTYLTMRRHLGAKHTLGMGKNHECFADKFHSDILTVFAQCYAKDGSTE